MYNRLLLYIVLAIQALLGFLVIFNIFPVSCGVGLILINFSCILGLMYTDIAIRYE